MCSFRVRAILYIIISKSPVKFFRIILPKVINSGPQFYQHLTLTLVVNPCLILILTDSQAPDRTVGAPGL